MMRTGNGDEPRRVDIAELLPAEPQPADDTAAPPPTADFLPEEEPPAEAPKDEFVPPPAEDEPAALPPAAEPEEEAEEEPAEEAQPAAQAAPQATDDESAHAAANGKKADGALAASIAALEGSQGDPATMASSLYGAIEAADRDGKEDAFAAIAKIYDDEDSTPQQIDAIERLLGAIRDMSTIETFEVAMRASIDMERNDHANLSAFLTTFTSRVAIDHATAQDEGCKEAYLEGLAAYAEAHPDKAMELANPMLDAWFADPKRAILWHGLMEMSEAGGSFAVTASTEEGVEVQNEADLSEQIKTAFYTKFAAQEDKLLYAIEVIRLIPPRAADLHITILDEMSSKAKLDSKMAMLDEIRTIEPEIGEGRKDPRAVRKVYGNIIAELKGICKDDDDCEFDINETEGKVNMPELYSERRRFAPFFHLSGFQATQAFMGVGGQPTEQIAYSGGANFDIIFSELQNGARLMTGLYFNGRNDHNWAAGARFGYDIDVGRHFNIKLPLSVGWTHTSAFDDERDDIPIELDGEGVNADGTAWTFVPNHFATDMHAAAVTVDPEFTIMFGRWPMKDHGATFGLGIFFGLTAGAFFGTMRDSQCSHAYTPGDAEISPSGTTYEVSQDADLGERCRDDAFTGGFIFGGKAGLTLEFGG